MKTWAFLLFTVLLLIAAPVARGDQIELSLTAGGGASVLILDGGPGDSNPAVGVITWIGAVGSWNINVSTGMMDPAGSSPGSIDLNSADQKLGGNETLDIEFTRWNMIPLFDMFIMDIGGTLVRGPLLYQAYRDQANVPFGQAELVGALGPFNTRAFSGTIFAFPGMPAARPYSLTQRITLSAQGPESVSFDASLQPVPEPGTGLLLGLGILAIGTFLRRRFV